MKRWCLCAMTATVLALACAAESENLLRNAGFESDDHTTDPGAYRQWVVASGSWHRRTGSPDPPSPAEGGYYYFPNDCTWATIYQQLDPTKLGLDTARLTKGGYYVLYSGLQCSWHEGGLSANDQGRIGLAQYSGFTLLDSQDLGWVARSHTEGLWEGRSGWMQLHGATNRLVYVFDAQERDMWPGTINDAFLDATELSIRPSDIWTHGATTRSQFGPGTWQIDGLGVGYGSDGGVCVTGHELLLVQGTTILGSWDGTGAGRGTMEIAEGRWYQDGYVYTGGAGGLVEVGPGGTWRASKGINGLDGGGLEVYVGGTWDSFSFVKLRRVGITGGTWTSLGPVTVTQLVDITGGTWNAHGEIDGGGTIRLAGGELNFSADGPLPWDRLVLESGTLALGRPLALPDTLEIGDCRLVHAQAPLHLAGAEIKGGGEVLVGSAGVNLGTIAAPGRLTGSGPADRLAVYGDISGSGTLTHVAVYGNVDIGNSAGEMSLADVLVGSGSAIAMEVLGAGAGECDRLILGPDVDFARCPIDIDFAGGFAPQKTDTFDLFDATGGADLPATLAKADIRVPVDWQLDVATGTLSYIPEPAALALLAVGGLALIRSRRRPS